MDIKAKIEGLSESEAKAALYELVCKIGSLSPCELSYGKCCPFMDDCGGDRWDCEKYWIEAALRED